MSKREIKNDDLVANDGRMVDLCTSCPACKNQTPCPPLACLFCIKQISYDGAITCCNAPSTNRLYNAHILEFCISLPYVHMPRTLRVCVCQGLRIHAYMWAREHACFMRVPGHVDRYICVRAHAGTSSYACVCKHHVSLRTPHQCIGQLTAVFA